MQVAFVTRVCLLAEGCGRSRVSGSGQLVVSRGIEAYGDDQCGVRVWRFGCLEVWRRGIVVS